MATLPDYLSDQTEETILQRMLETLPADLDRAEGSYVWDALAPAAMELAQAALWAREVLRRSFAATTFGAYLDLRAAEHGVYRHAATKAGGAVTISGAPGSVVPKGSRVATPADPLSGASSIEFLTISDATLDPTGQVVLAVEADEAGLSGNVPAGAVSLVVTSLPGVSGVTNVAATSGGTDVESDDSLRERYLQRVGSPSSGGNRADYVSWALQVPEVGGVAVIPVRDGPGTVVISVIDKQHRPAGQNVIDAVQDFISPPWVIEVEAEDEAVTRSGEGIEVDTSQTDDIGDSVLMVYDPAGEGLLSHSLVDVLRQAGVWQVRVRAKVDSTSGEEDLLQIGVYHPGAGVWAKTAPGSAQDALVTLAAGQLDPSFGDQTVSFYWNGTDHLELRITRLSADASTSVWVDRMVYRSTFSTDTGSAKAPIGARVTVEPATSVLINVAADLTITSGYDPAGVKSAVVSRLETYVRGLAFQSDNDVRYVYIGQTILETTGVKDYDNLVVNGGTANVPIGQAEVAVLGSVSLT